MKMIRLTAGEWRNLAKDIVGPGGKITAIKNVRQARLHQDDDGTGVKRPNISLREAKDAVDFHMDAIGMLHPNGSRHWSGGEPTAKLMPFQPIRRVVCDFGSGEVELDMEAVSLRILSSVSEVPIRDFTALVDLYKRIKDWEESQSVGGVE